MQDILLKKRTENDSEFFMRLFAEIKSSELRLDTWPEPIRTQMIRMQFNAYERCMNTEFPNNIDYLILYQSEKAGRLQLNNDEMGIRIINISLVPAYRNKGIGAKIISDLMLEANQKNKQVLLDVDKINRALNLYSRLGFKIVQENEIRYSMAYTPERGTSIN